MESVVSSQFSVANQKEPVSRKRPTPNMPRRGVAEGELERCCVVKSGETWGRRLGAAAGRAARCTGPARPSSCSLLPFSGSMTRRRCSRVSRRPCFLLQLLHLLLVDFPAPLFCGSHLFVSSLLIPILLFLSKSTLLDSVSKRAAFKAGSLLSFPRNRQNC